MEDCANSSRECPRAGPALPALASTVTAGVAAYRFTLAVGANWVAVPAYLFEVIDGLFLGLEGIKNLQDVHGLIMD
jgi:hypothetical protein